MRSTISLLLLVAFITCISCSTAAVAPSAPDVMTTELIDEAYTYAEFECDRKKYYESAANSDARRLMRNQITRRIMAIITWNFGQYESEIFTGRAFSATSFDIVNLGLDAAIAVSGGKSTKAVLGAIATAVHGTELSIDQNFFREKTTEALLSTMRAQRFAKEEEIERKLYLLNDTKYTLDESWKDLIELYQAGTLPSALITLAEIAAEKAQKEKKALEKLSENRTEEEQLKAFSAGTDKTEQMRTWFDALTNDRQTEVVNSVFPARIGTPGFRFTQFLLTTPVAEAARALASFGFK